MKDKQNIEKIIDDFESVTKIMNDQLNEIKKLYHSNQLGSEHLNLLKSLIPIWFYNLGNMEDELKDILTNRDDSI